MALPLLLSLSAAATTSSFPGYSAHLGVDITGANDTAFGSLCENAAFFGGFESDGRLWREPTAVCDLVGCPRLGLRGGARVGSAGPYCIKGWVVNETIDSYLSQHTYLSSPPHHPTPTLRPVLCAGAGWQRTARC